VRAGLEHDRPACRDAAVDEHWVAPSAPDRWYSPELEVGVVAPKVVLGGEVHVLLAAAGEVAQLALVEPAGSRDDGAQVPLERLDDEGLGDVVRLEP
jgi:hypothetical protein